MPEQKDAQFQNKVLATDLDGTLIPLAGNSKNIQDLARLKTELQNQNVGLVFVTGRDYPAVLDLINLHDLPVPDYLICDVGTSIYHKENQQFQINREYFEYQMQIVGSMTTEKTYDLIKSVEGLELQEEEKQGDFKLSFYVEATRLSDAVSEIDILVTEANAPYEITKSIDPFNGIGLVDLLPKNISKAGALKWWSEYHQLSSGSIVFAGDSGNDLSAMTSGYKTIVVGNAEKGLVDDVIRFHYESGWENRIFHSEHHATSGVLDGCEWFGLIES